MSNLTPVEHPDVPTKTTSAKAIVGAASAAVVAGLGALNASLIDNNVSGAEWLNIIYVMLGAIIGVGGVTYLVPNKPKA